MNKIKTTNFYLNNIKNREQTIFVKNLVLPLKMPPVELIFFVVYLFFISQLNKSSVRV